MLAISTTGDGVDAAVKREIAVLRTLAHLGSLSIQHLHALCFPGCMLTTARTHLRYLEEAGCVRHVRWRVKSSSGHLAQMWGITTKGARWAEYYMSSRTLPQILDLARPSTALEHEEWRVRIDLRQFLVKLIVETRRRPLLAHLTMAQPRGWPAVIEAGHDLIPDIALSVGWQSGTPKPADWLPWQSAPAEVADRAVRYAIFVDRQLREMPLERLWSGTRHDNTSGRIVVFVVHDRERYVLARQQLDNLPRSAGVRPVTWEMLEAGLVGGGWRDLDDSDALRVEPQQARQALLDH